MVGAWVATCSSPDEALARLRSGAPCDVVVAAELEVGNLSRPSSDYV